MNLIHHFRLFSISLAILALIFTACDTRDELKFDRPSSDKPKASLERQLADSSYVKGLFTFAYKQYSKFPDLDSVGALRMAVSKTLAEFESLTSFKQKYIWLRNILSKHNKKLYNDFGFNEDIIRYDGNTFSGNYQIGIREGRLIGSFGMTVCYPWGLTSYNSWHSGYYWDSELFRINCVIAPFSRGPLYYFLFSRNEIPKRKIQRFLFQNKGLITMETQFGEPIKVPMLEVVAVLGANRLVERVEDRMMVEELPPDDELTFQIFNLQGVFERIHTSNSLSLRRK